MDSLALLGIISVAVWLLALLNSHLLVVLNSIVSKWQRLDIISRVVAAVMTIIAVVEAQKSVPQNTESSLIALMRLPAPTVEATVSDLSSVSLPEEFQSVTNLCFWGIAKNDDSVSLGIAWPDWMRFTNDFLDIFSNNQCSSNGWQRLAQLNVAQISSNAIVEFPYETMPTNRA